MVTIWSSIQWMFLNSHVWGSLNSRSLQYLSLRCNDYFLQSFYFTHQEKEPTTRPLNRNFASFCLHENNCKFLYFASIHKHKVKVWSWGSATTLIKRGPSHQTLIEQRFCYDSSYHRPSYCPLAGVFNGCCRFSILWAKKVITQHCPLFLWSRSTNLKKFPGEILL